MAVTAAITVLSSTAARMVPHPVHVDLVQASSLGVGTWEAARAEWNFGEDGIAVTDPRTGRSITLGRRRLGRYYLDGQYGWVACHLYQTSGTKTIGAWLADSSGARDHDATTVTLAADTRVNRYVNASTGNNANDGTSATDEGGGVGPWETHAYAVTQLTSAMYVNYEGGQTFDVAGDDCSFDSVSNVIFRTRPGSTGRATIRWTSNPAAVLSLIEPESGCENIGVMSLDLDTTLSKTATVANNRGGGIRFKGRNCWAYDVTDSGHVLADSAMFSIPFRAGDNAGGPYLGTYFLNCSAGTANQYDFITENADNFVLHGCYLGPPNIEHCLRMLNPTNSRVAMSACSFDYGSGAGGKCTLRYSDANYCWVDRTQLVDGAVNLNYAIDSTPPPQYGQGQYLVFDRVHIRGPVVWAPSNRSNRFVNCLVEAFTASVAMFYNDQASYTPTTGEDISGIDIICSTVLCEYDTIIFNLAAGTAEDYTATGYVLQDLLFSVMAGWSTNKQVVRYNATGQFSMSRLVIPAVVDAHGLSREYAAAGGTFVAEQTWVSSPSFPSLGTDIVRETTGNAPATIAANSYRPTGTNATSLGVGRPDVVWDYFGHPRKASGSTYVGAVSDVPAVEVASVLKLTTAAGTLTIGVGGL